MTRPLVAGVVGWPIGHSRSPFLHATWLSRYGIAGYYVPLAVPPERLAAALRALPALGFAGVNVTVPHKQAAARLVDRLDDAAARTGSVNMITVGQDGLLEGASTDGYGFCASLEADLPSIADDTRQALVIGAGGAAYAIVDALQRRYRRPIRLANRTEAHAVALAERLGPDVALVPWSALGGALHDVGLLVNATSLGMTGQPPLSIDLGMLPRDAAVTDIVYSPLETPLLANARRRGNPVVDGLGMLLHQARPAFARWFGVDPAVDPALRAAVLAVAP